MNGERTSAGQTVTNDDYERRTGAVSAGWRRGTAWLRGDLRRSNDERGFPGPFGSNPIGVYEGIDTVARGNNDRTARVHLAVGPADGSGSRAGTNRIQPDRRATS